MSYHYTEKGVRTQTLCDLHNFYYNKRTIRQEYTSSRYNSFSVPHQKAHNIKQ